MESGNGDNGTGQSNVEGQRDSQDGTASHAQISDGVDYRVHLTLVVLDRAGPQLSVWYRGAQRHTTRALHPETHHNGECADQQKTTARVIASGALCVETGEVKYVLVIGG